MTGKNTTTCPRDHSTLRSEVRTVVIAGVPLGDFGVWVCPACHRVFDPPAPSRAIDRAAKAKGVWGTEAPEHLAAGPSAKGARAHA